MKKKSIVEPIRKQYKITFYTPQGAINQMTGKFSEEELEQLKSNIGRDFVYIGGNASFNLKFYHAMNVEIVDTEVNK